MNDHDESIWAVFGLSLSAAIVLGVLLVAYAVVVR